MTDGNKISVIMRLHPIDATHQWRLVSGKVGQGIQGGHSRGSIVNIEYWKSSLNDGWHKMYTSGISQLDYPSLDGMRARSTNISFVRCRGFDWIREACFEYELSPQTPNLKVRSGYKWLNSLNSVSQPVRGIYDVDRFYVSFRAR